MMSFPPKLEPKELLGRGEECSLWEYSGCDVPYVFVLAKALLIDRNLAAFSFFLS